ncbi:hypothetical protein Vadar_023110 [Vaccinium darrowii]|uniref:Uncharacterized protein n=1 Tax=Vaccinium darrowii TaxID=229202 RepID=A0ACB7YFT7_9ERIC|nr:hypothetical protein Vadar_023110 [Vaccinium darrowii]
MSGEFEIFPSVSHVSIEGNSPPNFDESPTKSARPDEFSPLTFDESEGPTKRTIVDLIGKQIWKKSDSVSDRKEDLTYFPDYEWVQDNLKSSAMEQPSSPLRAVTSAGTESPKSSTSSGELPSRESPLKKNSHVHPKLPGYDTIAAQFQSLQSNR